MKAGFLHPNRIVRNVVAKYFKESFTRDPDVTRQAIQGLDQFGWQNFIVWPHMLREQPMLDDESFEWVCRQLERTDAEAPGENEKRHLSLMLASADISLLKRHQSQLLAMDVFRPAEREKIVNRLRLAQLEPLVLAGDRFAPQILDILKADAPPMDGSGSDDWLIGMMIILAGKLRLEAAVPHLWKFWETDWDWYNEEVMYALTRIGTPSVVQLVREKYSQSEWYVRNYAHNLLENIRCDEAVEAIEILLADEKDDLLCGQLGIAATA